MANLEHWWMPFSANRAFKKSPKLIQHAEGMWLYNQHGERLLDATAGLWCVNAGHNRAAIADAISAQARQLDFSSPFNLGHEIGFQFAERLVQYTPPGLDRVFFTNSGSEAVETALKIALAYQHARGKVGKTKLIGRQKGYHGVNFGGISVGGLTPNRTAFGPLLAVDHLPHTLDLERNAFSQGLPPYGIEQAEALADLFAFHDPSTIAAVIVEPVQGAGGVILPPPGYLQRLRDLCTEHDVLLIFDEVITGWGRLGDSFAANEFAVTPDMITSAKGITNGVIPLGATFVSQAIYHTVVESCEQPGIELFHGYTYSGHPVACAAGLATLDIYDAEGLLTRGQGEMGRYFASSLHSLKGTPGIIDIRAYGLVGAVHFAPTQAGSYIGPQIMQRCYEYGLSLRAIGDIIALSPPLIIEKSHIDQIVDTLQRIAGEIYR